MKQLVTHLHLSHIESALDVSGCFSLNTSWPKHQGQVFQRQMCLSDVSSGMNIKTPAKKCQPPAKKSNSRKSRKVIQSKFLEPTWSHHWLQTVWQTHGHGKFVATVATPGILNFTRKQEMLEISLKRMIQVQSMWNWSDCCAAGLIGPPSMESQWSRSYS